MCLLPCRLKGLVQASKDPAVLRYVIQNLGVGVRPDSPNWPLILNLQQIAQQRYMQVVKTSQTTTTRPQAVPAAAQSRLQLLQVRKLVLSQLIRQRVALAVSLIQQRQAALNQSEMEMNLDLGRLSQLEAMDQFDLFLRQLAFQGTTIRTGKLKKLQDLSSESPESLRKKIRTGDVETRWMALQVVAAKRYHLEDDLIERLMDPDASVRRAARQALVRVSRGVDFGPPAKASKAGRDKAVRRWRLWWSQQDCNMDRKFSLATGNP